MVPPAFLTAYLERISPDGPERMAQFVSLGTRIKLGRGHSDDFKIPLPTISKYRPEFQFRDDQWEVRDLGQNNISVNYKRIPRHGYVVLGNNDIISFLHDGLPIPHYRYVNAGIGPASPTPMDVDMPPQMVLPLTPCQSPPHATPEPENTAEVSRTGITVEGHGEQRDHPSLPSPLSDAGSSSSVGSSDTGVLPGWTGRTRCSPCELLTLKGKLAQAGTENYNLKRQLESAKEEIETRFRGHLMKLLEEEMNCAICNDVFIEPKVVKCGHVFCSHCITTWIEEQRIRSNIKPTCPTCRAEIGSLRKVRFVDGFTGRAYSLLSTEAKENRKRSLLQRRDEIEHRGAVQVAGRLQEQENIPEQGETTAEVRIAQHTSTYDTAFRPFVDQEMEGEAVIVTASSVAFQNRALAPAQTNVPQYQPGHQFLSRR